MVQLLGLISFVLGSLEVGVLVGLVVGDVDGATVEDLVGQEVGVLVGLAVGDVDGATVGVLVGQEVGVFVGLAVGDVDGATVGVAVSQEVGLLVGLAVGDVDGATVGMIFFVLVRNHLHQLLVGSGIANIVKQIQKKFIKNYS